MELHRITIDEEVWAFLQGHAIPFRDKEPNDVLRRLLLHKENIVGVGINIPTEILNIPSNALQEILEVYWLVRNGKDRIDATHEVANQRNITYQSVVDKYTRQVGKKSHEIDQLMRPGEENENNFRFILEQRFPRYQKDIEAVFLKVYEKTDGLQT